MSLKLNLLLSPERLRQHWQKPFVPVAVLSQNPQLLSIQTEYLQLHRLITTQYPDAIALSIKLEELTTLIQLIFDTNTAVIEDVQKKAVVNILEELEELLWVVDLSERKIK